MVADEMWVAEKFQSNSEIAGSLRNSFRASLVVKITGGKALNGLGAERLLNPIKLRMPDNCFPGVRRREISFVVKRERAQTHS